MSQTIPLPVGQAANISVVLTSDDNTVYMGLPPGIVAGTDIAVKPGPPTNGLYPETAFLFKGTVKIGTGIGGAYNPIGTYPDGIGQATYAETSYVYALPRQAWAISACGGTGIYANSFYYAAELDTRPFNYTVSTVRNNTATGDTRQGAYTHYLVKPIYDQQSCYLVGSNLTVPYTFLGYCYRKLEFQIGVNSGGGGGEGGGGTPTPCTCCDWRLDAGPMQAAWTPDSGPSACAWQIQNPCGC